MLPVQLMPKLGQASCRSCSMWLLLAPRDHRSQSSISAQGVYYSLQLTFMLGGRTIRSIVATWGSGPCPTNPW